LLDHVALHVREAALHAVVLEGQLLVIEAGRMEEAGVQIAKRGKRPLTGIANPDVVVVGKMSRVRMPNPLKRVLQ